MMARRLALTLGVAGLLSPLYAAAQAVDAPRDVEILSAQRAGEVKLTLRGQGEDKVRVQIKNTSGSRLNVVIPPGLVASAATGQGGGGGGFQSMGLGTPTSSGGGFGSFLGTRTVDNGGGFRSVPVVANTPGVVVPAGQSYEFSLPSVCLNYGIATPTHRDEFKLVDVNDYSPDHRVRRALRSLSSLGTSQAVAQAVMWHVCNGLSFEQLAVNGAKSLNSREIAVAARFVAALDAGSAADELVSLGSINQNRLQYRIQADGKLAKDAKRLDAELDGRIILGLPVRHVPELDRSADNISAVHMTVALSLADNGKVRGKVTLRHAEYEAGWTVLGTAKLAEDIDVASLDGATLADVLDRSIAAGFVSTRVVSQAGGLTRLSLASKLPLTVADVILRTGKSADETTLFHGIGLGPNRSVPATVPAAGARVERVVLNGL